MCTGFKSSCILLIYVIFHCQLHLSKESTWREKGQINSTCLVFVLRCFFLTKYLQRPQRRHNLIILATFSRIIHLSLSASLHKGIPSSEICTYPVNCTHQKSYESGHFRTFTFNPLVPFLTFSYLK